MSVSEIKARWAAATPGPWRKVFNDYGDGGEEFGIEDAKGFEFCALAYDNGDDSEAIAHAPQDIAELLEVVGECKVVIAEQNHCLEAFNETRVDGPGGVIRRLRALENSFQARNKAEALLAKLEEAKSLGRECNEKYGKALEGLADA